MSVLTDPQALRSALKRLEEARKERRLDVQDVTSIAEAAFRLALLPCTSPSESIRLLRRCIRLDGTNPRYAYHLGRLYFTYGDLEQAKLWFRHVMSTCPTSHRVWTHASELLCELNALYVGNDSFEPNALRRRAESLREAVRAGRAGIEAEWRQFEPPMSLASQEKASSIQGDAGVDEASAPAERKQKGKEEALQARTAEVTAFPPGCRWSGCYDLIVERALEAEPTRRSLEAMVGSLEHVARLSLRRPGGAAAFCVLAVQWLCSGYPVTTIRRLIPLLPRGDVPSLRMLDCVCAIHEADREQVPALLAEALEQDEMPQELAAIMHVERVLWRSLHYRAPRTYRTARIVRAEADRIRPDDAVAEDLGERSADIDRRLRQRLAVLDGEAPVALSDLAEQAVGTLDPAGTADALNELEDCASTLDDARKRVRRFLIDSLKPLAEGSGEADGLARFQVDGALFLEVVEMLERTARARRDRLAAVSEAVATLDARRAPEGFSRRRETCERQFAEAARVGPLRRTFDRIRKKVDTASKVPESMEPSLEITALLRSIRDAMQPTGNQVDGIEEEPEQGDKSAAMEGGDGTEKVPAAGETPVSYLQKSEHGIEAAICGTHERLEELFAGALDSFRPYGTAAQAPGPLWLVRRSVEAHWAETLYRLGHRQRARRIWAGMLREDPLDLAVRKNLAVCDTGSVDVARALASWKAFVEHLYTLDLLSGDPRGYADLRADVHRELAHGYAIPVLAEELDRDWAEKVSQTDVAQLLGQPGRVRGFVEHKLLEFLNRHLMSASPLLILGVTRLDSPQRREEAAARLLGFADMATRALPERVGTAFLALVQRHIEQALLATGDHHRLLLKHDVTYPAERDRHLAFLVDFARLKYKLLAMVTTCEAIAEDLSSVEFLPQMRRLDQLPLDVGAEFVTVAAGSIQHSPEELMSLMELLETSVVRQITTFVYDGTDNDGPRRQYRALVDRWAARPALREHLAVIDNPQHCLPADLIDCLVRGEFPAKSVKRWRRWHDLYPETTGIARGYAHALKANDHIDDAICVLEAAAEHGMSAPGRTECADISRHFQFERAVNAERFDEAGSIGLELLREDDRQPRLASNVLNVFVRAAQETRIDPGRKELTGVLQDWMKRAREFIEGWAPADDEPVPPIMRESLREVARERDSGLVQIIVAVAGGPKGTDYENMVTELRAFLKESPDVPDAVFYLMTACFNCAASLSHRGHQAMRGMLEEAKTHAVWVSTNASDPKQRQQAQELQKKIITLTPRT